MLEKFLRITRVSNYLSCKYKDFIILVLVKDVDEMIIEGSGAHESDIVWINKNVHGAV